MAGKVSNHKNENVRLPVCIDSSAYQLFSFPGSTDGTS